MREIATTRLSSKGQVVIPEGIRDRLGLRPGARFMVIGDQDVVILKTLAPRSMDEFDSLIARARRATRKAGMKRSAVRAAVAKTRSRP